MLKNEAMGGITTHIHKTEYLTQSPNTRSFTVNKAQPEAEASATFQHA